MVILVPMGGKGERFAQAGYSKPKACLPLTDRHTGKTQPMVLCALGDLPGIHDPLNQLICVDRDFHAEDGTEEAIRKVYPKVQFIHDTVLLDQAYGCYLARDRIRVDEALFIGACDNGVEAEWGDFEKAQQDSDVLVLVHTNDTNIENNPHAHSWAVLGPDGRTLKAISLKTPVSENPMRDFATTGMFWFKRGGDFISAIERMLESKDSLNGKYYVDRAIQYCIDASLRVRIFNVKYLCWGTPPDYETYEQIINYWKGFLKAEGAK